MVEDGFGVVDEDDDDDVVVVVLGEFIMVVLTGFLTGGAWSCPR
jgi:hypothetical protein